jgi:zinc transport system ATP-binding protein
MSYAEEEKKMDRTVVDIKDLSFSYNSQPVLEDVNLSIREGDFIAVIGPNGGGKTTLLKLVLGLLKPRSGEIRVLGRPATKISGRIGYVPQDVNINRNFPITALDVVLMGRLTPGKRWARRSVGDRREAVQALEKLEMAAFAARKMSELSGGQRQRVFIARALVTRPLLLLLDEPTANIDSKGQSDFYRLLEKLNSEITILAVSHDLLAVSTYVKSVACVNRRVHYHHQAEITGDMLSSMYPCTMEEVCPVELITHGHLPHRVLRHHED